MAVRVAQRVPDIDEKIGYHFLGIFRPTSIWRKRSGRLSYVHENFLYAFSLLCKQYRSTILVCGRLVITIVSAVI